MTLIPFRARARTVDHLGREQIADCPTAVSELWKNAYDAYARRVALHVFGGAFPIAAIVDDGTGMSRDEFVDRWLMLGTDSKVDATVPAADRQGLPVRPRQGQKGIGRLSVAYLGPTVLVLSKRTKHDFVAALVDWRLFQNPYLLLEDVRIPVETFRARGDFDGVLDALRDGLVENLWGSTKSDERTARIKKAWSQYSSLQKASKEPITADAIEALVVDGRLEARHLQEWQVWNGTAEHGTAMFVLDVNRELNVWVDASATDGDLEVSDVKNKLRHTLNGFSDPYRENPEEDFSYTALAHDDERVTTIVDVSGVFGYNDLFDLEHVVDGAFDAAGLFKGTVRAWGKDLGEVSVVPARPPPVQGRGYVGPFSIRIGTFEQDEKNSSMPPEVVARLRTQAEQFSGLAVYRDGLRVQPYGRPENDFFGMEERRAKHQGREYWASRRTFGRVAIERNTNPSLRDKAGREGFIDNQAAREFKYLIVEMLKTLARRYFGSDAELREDETSVANERHRRSQEAERRARKHRASLFREGLKRKPRLDECCSDARELHQQVVAASSPRKLEQLDAQLERLRAARAELALPPKPRQLGALESAYHSYRDALADLAALLEACAVAWRERVTVAAHGDPAEISRSALARHQRIITDRIGAWRDSVRSSLKKEGVRWDTRASEDGTRYYVLAAPVVEGASSGAIGLGRALRELEALRTDLLERIEPDYQGYLRALDLLADDIDLEAAAGWASDERERLGERVLQWQELAQMGITVEIIGHELNDTAHQVSRNLQRLPTSVRGTEAYKLANDGFRSLVQRLQFLAPLRLSGPRLRERITGEYIETYLRNLFGDQLRRGSVSFDVTASFRATTVVEYTHRLLPVYSNLMNNALYWTTLRDERRVVIDRVGDRVIFADSGPGVPDDDQRELFGLFFTRRLNGHGIGLYLCRINLQQGRHTIRYGEAADRILSGANFVLEFRELQ